MDPMQEMVSMVFLPDDVIGHIFCQTIDSKQFRTMSNFSQTCRKMNEICCEIQNTLKNSNIEYEKWLVKNRKRLSQKSKNENGDSEINLASENGDLKIIKIFHENRKDGFTTEAMDLASANGHLDIVKFLHNNRTEGCTKRAMDSASLSGYLDNVKLLHENRTEGCTDYAMIFASI